MEILAVRKREAVFPKFLHQTRPKKLGFSFSRDPPNKKMKKIFPLINPLKSSTYEPLQKIIKKISCVIVLIVLLYWCCGDGPQNIGSGLTGVSGTANVGTVIGRVSKTQTGVSATGAVGTVGIKIDDTVLLTGVVGTGAIGTVIIGGWTTINDAQDPNWQLVDDAQTVQ